MNQRYSVAARQWLWRLACLLSAFGVAALASAQPLPMPTLAPSLEPQVTATLDPTRVAPGESAQWRITVLVPTFMPRPVTFPSFDQTSLRIQLPESATTPISQTRQGRTWAGISRRYTVTPLAAGEFTLGQGGLEITFQDPETGETLTRTQALTPQTLSAAVPAAAAGLSPYIAGTALTLRQRLTVTRTSATEATEGAEGTEEKPGAASTESAHIKPIVLAIGDSLEREIVVSLEGGSALLLPSLAAAHPNPTMAVHAASPMFAETPSGGARTERLTYIAQHGGAVVLPEITVRWFDLERQRIASASVPAVAIAIDGEAIPAPMAGYSLRQYATSGIAVLLLGVLVFVGWRWLWPVWHRVQQQRQLRRERSGVTLLKRFARQVQARRYGESLNAWRALQRQVPDLPHERQQTISRCLAALGRERYARATAASSQRSNAAWRDLRQALPHAADLRRARPEPRLPPLNPRALKWS